MNGTITYDGDDDNVAAGSVPNLLVLLLQGSTSYPFLAVSSRTKGIKKVT
jgi:hypothetical protein